MVRDRDRKSGPVAAQGNPPGHLDVSRSDPSDLRGTTMSYNVARRPRSVPQQTPPLPIRVGEVAVRAELSLRSLPQ
jgi:hypothetical protein